ncbi:SAM-dependent methyltransferase, partial [Francisella tularensis]|uniref:SAM-dependent methyltransferase n=1 Tax=Francisella tularensis TaxID=263 RepID=UPI002381AE53
QLFKPNMFVVDLGASPGGLSEQVIKYIGKNGKLISLDLLEMAPIAGEEFIQGDFSSDETYQILNPLVNPQKIDCVISDMAPNL